MTVDTSVNPLTRVATMKPPARTGEMPAETPAVQPQAAQPQAPTQQTPAPSQNPASGPTGGGGSGYATPYAQTSQINPSADLRGTQILPGMSPRTTATTGQADTARDAFANAPAATPFRAIPAAGDPRTAQADQYLNQAGASLPGGYQAIGAGNMGGQAGSLLQQAVGATGGIGGASFGGDTGEARAATMRALQALETAPNRGEIARGQYDLMAQESAPQFEQDLRRVGQRAAALGRVGAGMTTSDLGTVQQRREEAMARNRAGLSLDAASQEMSDRLKRVSAGQGVASSFGGLDLNASDLNQRGAMSRAGALSNLSSDVFNREGSLRAEARGENDRSLNFGINQGSFLNNLGQTAFDRGASLRGEDRVERNTERDFNNDDFSRVQTKFQNLADVADNARGWDASDRGELRGERGYQGDLNREAMGNGIDRTLMEEQLLNGQFGRNLDATNTQARIGYGSDPTGILSGQASGYANQAGNDYAGGADLLGEALAGRVPSGMTRDQADGVIGSSTPTMRPAPYAPRPIAPMQPIQTVR